MPTITISEEAYNFLAKVAQERNTTVEQWIEDYAERLRVLDPPEIDTSDMPELGTLAALAWAARKYPISSDETDISERSREILNNEFPDYLLNRMREGNATETPDSD